MVISNSSLFWNVSRNFGRNVYELSLAIMQNFVHSEIIQGRPQGGRDAGKAITLHRIFIFYKKKFLSLYEKYNKIYSSEIILNTQREKGIKSFSSGML